VSGITFNGTVTGNGQGQTIAIIDAYYDPNIASDLAKFDSQYAVNTPPSFTLTQYVESGLTTDNSGWALETALDVEWAHAIAPAANIDLVEAQPYLTDLFNAVTYASGLSGVSVVSMSWGTGDFSGESAYDGTFTTPVNHGNVTFVASSGDSGGGVVEYPSSSPNVLAVGGTTLSVTAQGAYVSESGWSGSGGGYSAGESDPSWQQAAQTAGGVQTGARTTPDVAWDGNPNSGVSVYDSVPYGTQSGWFTVGGTSAGSPAWAGLIAIANQGLALAHVSLLSNASASLYQLPASDFHDITTGSNGYSAGTGYDLVTGLGSPRANLVVAGLVTGNGGGSVTVSAAPALPPSSASVSAHDLPLPTSPGSSSGGFGSASSGSAPAPISIAPLSPNAVVVVAAPGKAVVVVVVQPTPQPVHLSASTAPVAQSLTSLLSSPDSSANAAHIGQGTGDELDANAAQQPIMIDPRGPAPMDVVEPFQPGAGGRVPDGPPVLPTEAWRGRLSPALFRRANEAVWDMPVWDLLPGAIGRLSTPSAAGPQETQASFGLSTMIGVAAVASGGYHLAFRDRSRFRGRWIPGRIPRAGR
jgi:hypothetical protein